MWSRRGRSRRRRHGGPLEIRCCPCSWPRFLRPFGFVRLGTGAISYLTIGMQANRAEATPVIGRSAPAPSDTRGKHRISAEVKRLEQESRSLEVNSLSLAPSLPLSLPIFGLQFPSGKEIYRRKLKGQNFYPFLSVLDNCRGLLFHFPFKGSFWSWDRVTVDVIPWFCVSALERFDHGIYFTSQDHCFRVHNFG